MAEYVGAGAAADFNTVDDSAADHVEQIGCGGERYRRAEYAAGGKEIVGDQHRRADRLPFDVAVVDDLDRRQIGLDRPRNAVGRERCVRGRQIAAELYGDSAFDPNRTKSPARSEAPLS